MAYAFVSYVGTQIMSVLQPIVACCKAGMEVETVRLYATPESMVVAGRIRDYCRENGFPSVTVGEWNAKALDSEMMYLTEAVEDRGIIFNVDGGMNYAVAEMAHRLGRMGSDTDAVLACTEDRQVALTRCADLSTEYVPCTFQFGPEEILDLQGVVWERLPKPEPARDLCTIFRTAGVQLPSKLLCNVRVGNVDFDMVWNDGGNRLGFLTTCYTRNDPAELRRRTRDIAQWAATKGRTDHLYDRDCYVLCPNDITEEHFGKESGGKVVSVRIGYSELYAGMGEEWWIHLPEWCGQNRACVREAVQDIFRSRPKLRAPSSGSTVEVGSDTLVVACGTDPAPTLSAIVSAGLPNVVVCHTTDDAMMAVVGRLKAVLVDMPSVGTVRTVATDVHGRGLLKTLVPEEGAKNIQVNVTPGTKGQAAFLALWAARHEGCRVVSLDRGEVVGLVDGRRTPMTEADPMSLLKVRYDGIDESMADCGGPLYGLLLENMRACLAEGREWGIWNRTACDAGDVLVRRNGTAFKTKEWTVSRRDGSDSCGFTEEGGEWLELLAVHAMRLAGAEHVHSRVRGRYSEAVQTRIEQEKHAETHRIDMDVIGVLGGRHFLLSCKSREEQGGEEALEAVILGAVKDVLTMAPTVSRFCLPALCHLSCRKAGIIETPNGAALVFGWRELCRPETLPPLFASLDAHIKERHGRGRASGNGGEKR